VVNRGDLAVQFMFMLAYISASEILDKDMTLTAGCDYVTCRAAVRSAVSTV
jgi:hypothetical protein